MPPVPTAPEEGRAPPELVDFADRLQRTCLEPLARWYDCAGDDARREAVTAFSPQSLRRALLTLLEEVEGWYWKRHAEEVQRAANARGVDPGPGLPRPEERGWLREALRPRLDALLDAAIDAQTGARDSLDFARRRLGGDGLGEGLARAATLLLRFWELPAALRRQFAALRQASLLDARLRQVLDAFEEEVGRLSEALEDAVVARWNARTVPLLEGAGSGRPASRLEDDPR